MKGDALALVAGLGGIALMLTRTVPMLHFPHPGGDLEWNESTLSWE